MIYHKMLVVGGGLSGLRAAIEATDKNIDVAVLAQVYPIRSHSNAAQGGVNVALANIEACKDDTPEKHAFDTVKGGDYLTDQDAAEVMANEAPGIVYELEHWGCPFSRTEDGKLNQRPFGGQGFPRTAFAADKTGRAMLHTLFEQAIGRKVKIYPEWVMLMMVVEDNVCKGITAYHIPTGRLEAFGADAIVLATGGYGRIYARSTNSLINSGGASGIAYYAGAALEDMEFVQFHPTTLVGTNILMSEGARSEGAYLINNKGERFMKNYTPNVMELAPRDIVARSIQTEINEGRGFENDYVLLDLRHLGRERILERLPEIRMHAIHFSNVDAIEKPIPIQPAQHYSMGGVACNVDGETEIKGLFVAGECACVSVHGANRLGGNSLLETVVFGHRAGAKASEFVKGTKGKADEKALERALAATKQKLTTLQENKGAENPADIRQEMCDTMTNKVGIFRVATQMTEAVNKIMELKARYTKIRPISRGNVFNFDLVRTYELKAMLDVAEITARGALARQESRGSHFRTDFKNRDDTNWLKHTLAHYTLQGPRFTYKKVSITKWQPEERKY